jgi:hypothetical protein
MWRWVKPEYRKARYRGKSEICIGPISYWRMGDAIVACIAWLPRDTLLPRNGPAASRTVPTKAKPVVPVRK